LSSDCLIYYYARKKAKIAKKDYKKAPLSKVHLRVLTAIVLGQFTCGFSLGITGGALTNAAKYIQISDMWIGLIGAGGLLVYLVAHLSVVYPIKLVVANY